MLTGPLGSESLTQVLVNLDCPLSYHRHFVTQPCDQDATEMRIEKALAELGGQLGEHLEDRKLSAPFRVHRELCQAFNHGGKQGTLMLIV